MVQKTASGWKNTQLLKNEFAHKKMACNGQTERLSIVTSINARGCMLDDKTADQFVSITRLNKAFYRGYSSRSSMSLDNKGNPHISTISKYIFDSNLKILTLFSK